MTPVPPSPSRPLSITVPPRDTPTVDGCDDGQADTDIRPRLWMTAYEGQDPLEYAAAAAPLEWAERGTQVILKARSLPFYLSELTIRLPNLFHSFS